MTEVKRDLSADLVAETVKRDLHHDLTICNAATPGPWRYDAPDDDCDDHYVLDALDRYIAQTTYDTLSSSMRHNYVEDARFIAEARAGWPEAIRRAMAAEEALAKLQAEYERIRLRNIERKARLERLHELNDANYARSCEYAGENQRLNAEVERLRAVLERIGGATVSQFVDIAHMAAELKRTAILALKPEEYRDIRRNGVKTEDRP